MNRTHAHNLNNESQIDFLEAAASDCPDSDSFYAAAIRIIWEGMDSVERTDRYIANANKRERTVSEVAAVVQESAAITPIKGLPAINAPEDAYSFRDDWNIKEFVWKEDGMWRMLSWETSA